MLFHIEMCRKGSSSVTGMGELGKDLAPFVKHFGVNTPEELTGKSFDSEDDFVFSALEALRMEVLHGGDYIPPDYSTLFEAAAKALSRMELPDFSDVASQDVFAAFQSVFDRFRANKKWLSWFSGQVAIFSEGRVTISEGNVDDFKMRVKGPADYLLLVNHETEESKRLVLGPYATPLSFDTD